MAAYAELDPVSVLEACNKVLGPLKDAKPPFQQTSSRLERVYQIRELAACAVACGIGTPRKMTLTDNEIVLISDVMLRRATLSLGDPTLARP